MDAIKIIHAADLHVGAVHSSLGALASLRGGEILHTLGRIVALCREENARLLLIAGDLFDSNAVSEDAVLTADSLFASIPETAVLIVPGNHDFLSSDSPYRREWSKNVHVFFEREVVTVDGVSVHGIPFTSAFSGTFSLPEPCDGTNILLMHGDLSGGPYNPITEATLERSGMDYVALGHVHKFSGINREGNTAWAYPGCPEALGFDETGEKGVIVGTVKKGAVELSFRPVCKRQYKEIPLDISECADNSAVLSAAREALSHEQNNLIKLNFTGKTDRSPDLAFLRSSLENEVFFLKLSDRTRAAYNLDILKNEPSLKGIFVKKMLEKIDAAEEEQKEKLITALYLGLDAIDGKEVTDYDN